MQRIEHQVYDHLLDLGRIGECLDAVAGRDRLNVRLAFPQLEFEHHQRFIDHIAQVDRLPVAGFGFRELEELANYIGRFFGALADVVGKLRHLLARDQQIG